MSTKKEKILAEEMIYNDLLLMIHVLEGVVWLFLALDAVLVNAIRMLNYIITKLIWRNKKIQKKNKKQFAQFSFHIVVL